MTRAERRQRQHDAAMRFAVLEPDVEDETVLLDAEHEPVGPAAANPPARKLLASRRS